MRLAAALIAVDHSVRFMATSCVRCTGVSTHHLLARSGVSSTVRAVPAPSLSIIALVDWPSERLHASMVPSRLRRAGEMRSTGERGWAEALTQRGVELFDGPLCRLESLTANQDALHPHLSPTSYRGIIGAMARQPQWAYVHGRQVMANAMGTS